MSFRSRSKYSGVGHDFYDGGKRSRLAGVCVMTDGCWGLQSIQLG